MYTMTLLRNNSGSSLFQGRGIFLYFKRKRTAASHNAPSSPSVLKLGHLWDTFDFITPNDKLPRFPDVILPAHLLATRSKVSKTSSMKLRAQLSESSQLLSEALTALPHFFYSHLAPPTRWKNKFIYTSHKLPSHGSHDAPVMELPLPQGRFLRPTLLQNHRGARKKWQWSPY